MSTELLDRLNAKLDGKAEPDLVDRLNTKLDTDPGYMLPKGYTDPELQQAQQALSVGGEEDKATNQEYFQWLVAKKGNTIEALRSRGDIPIEDLAGAVAQKELADRIKDAQMLLRPLTDLEKGVEALRGEGEMGFWESAFTTKALPGRGFFAGRRLRKAAQWRREAWDPDDPDLAFLLEGTSLTEREEAREWIRMLDAFIGEKKLYLEEESIRGQTILGKAGSIAGMSAVLGMEFYATGGAAAVGKTLARRSLLRILGRTALRPGVKGAVKLGSVIGGATVRAGLMPHRVAGIVTERAAPGIGIGEAGQLVVGAPAEITASDIFKAFGSVVIQNVAEVAGPTITKAGKAIIGRPIAALLNRFPKSQAAVGRVTGALQRAWLKLSPKNSSTEFVRRVTKAGGYHGMLEEVGEEELERILNESFGLGESDDPNILRRLTETIPSWQDYLAQVIAFSIPMVTASVAGAPQAIREGREAKELAQVEGAAEREAVREAAVGVEMGVERQLPEAEPAAAPIVTAPTLKADVGVEPAPPVEAPLLEPLTSARKAHVLRDRELMGRGGLPSHERVTWETDQDRAMAQGIPERAQRIAAEIFKKPRALNPEESAGFVVQMVTLKNEYEFLLGQLDALTDAAEITTKSAEVNRVEQEFDNLTRALLMSGSERGRMLASQKLTLARDYSLIAVKNRAKAAKGAQLTAKQVQALEALTQKLRSLEIQNEELLARVNSIAARRAVRRVGAARYKSMSATARDQEYRTLMGKTKKLLNAGCYDA